MSDSKNSAHRPAATQLIAGAGVVLLAACGEPAPGSVETEEVIDDLEYYYACGNETLELEDGRTFYPLYPEEQEDFDDSPYESPGPSASGGWLVVVNPPGPGDDTGVLRVYEDGMAHWESESGIEAWLTDEPQRYDWVC